MKRLDIYWLWFGDDYDERVTGLIAEVYRGFKGTDDYYFSETDLLDATRVSLYDVGIEVLSNQPSRGYTEENYESWVRLELAALAYTYSIFAGLPDRVRADLQDGFELARGEMFGYYV